MPLDLCAAGRYTIQVNKVAVADAALTLRAKGRRVHTKERAAGRASLFVQCGLLPRKPYFFSQAGSPRRNRNIWRCFTISGKKEMEINEGIRDREVRVIDADGSQLGIMSTRDALAKAEEKNSGPREDRTAGAAARVQIPGLREVPLRDAETRQGSEEKTRRSSTSRRSAFPSTSTRTTSTPRSARRRSFCPRAIR